MGEGCRAEFGEVTLDCELPEGHEGNHRATIEWDNNPWPAVVLLAGGLAVADGYARFLQSKYEQKAVGE